jgi:DNA-binding MarR family transcriptional regulator
MHATVPSTQAQVEVDPQIAELVAHLGGFAKFLLHSGGRDFYEAVGELDLSISQIRTLHLLSLHLEEASLKTLADEIGLSMPAVSRSVDGLVHRGLVTRAENAGDRRLKTVKATDEAHALVGRLTELRIAGIADFVTSLPEDQRAQLAAALAPIAARDDIAPLVATSSPKTESATKDA